MSGDPPPPLGDGGGGQHINFICLKERRKETDKRSGLEAGSG